MLGNATSSAVNAAQQGAALQTQHAQTEQIKEQTRSIRWDTDMKSVWTKYETAARLAEIMSRHSTATAKGGRLYDESGRSLGPQGNEAYIARIIAQMEADLRLTQTGARQGAADANIKELFNRPMLKKGYDYMKGRISPMFKSSAWEQYMDQKRPKLTPENDPYFRKF